IGPSFMKMFGIGTGLAILIDATLVRGVLVPAFMRVAGDLNWWAPQPLTRMLVAFDRVSAKASGTEELSGPPPARRESGVWSLPPAPPPEGAPVVEEPAGPVVTAADEAPASIVVDPGT